MRAQEAHLPVESARTRSDSAAGASRTRPTAKESTAALTADAPNRLPRVWLGHSRGSGHCGLRPSQLSQLLQRAHQLASYSEKDPRLFYVQSFKFFSFGGEFQYQCSSAHTTPMKSNCSWEPPAPLSSPRRGPSRLHLAVCATERGPGTRAFPEQAGTNAPAAGLFGGKQSSLLLKKPLRAPQQTNLLPHLCVGRCSPVHCTSNSLFLAQSVR